MAATNLSSLNVDKLFEQHSVAEIDIIQKKVQAVVEKKREEIRLMVGESYRDLLQAADTIAAMQSASEVLIKNIDSIMVNCRQLNEQQLIGFKTIDECSTSEDLMLKQRQANKLLNNYFNLMIQLKLLIILPEAIWSQIDKDRFYHAAELFIFSSHVSAGLQLDSNRSVMKHFPVAKKQWDLLKTFHGTIKQRILRTLERETIRSDITVDCILALLLLEKSSINNVIKIFMQLRCNAYSKCLKEDIVLDDGEWRPVKDRILASLNVLYGTMVLLEKCLLDNGLLQEKLREYTTVAPTIALLGNQDYLHTHMLPDIIANFRPKLEVQNVGKEQISDAIEKFLNDTKSTEAHLKNCFSLIDSIRAIQEIKEKANETKKLINVPAIKEKFQLRSSLEFYEMQYLPQINQRVQDLVDKSWSDLMQETLQKIADTQSTIAARSYDFWSDESEDLPLSLAMALNENIMEKKLLMKIKGYNSDILKLCKDFDDALADIIKEINVLIMDQFTRSEDKANLVEFLRNTSQSKLHEFLKDIENLKSISKKNESLIFLARTCVALLELSPHLKSCYSPTAAWRQQLGYSTNNLLQKSSEDWQQTCQLFNKTVVEIWELIIENILTARNYKEILPSNMTSSVILDNFTCWETVSLEQRDEQENVINSNFRIPSQPTIFLQSYLFDLVALLNETIPETLPSQIIHIFNQKLIQQLSEYYEDVSKTIQNVPTISSLSLQFYFDLKFLQSIFTTSPNQRNLNDRLAKLQMDFKQNIDPFDFELFSDNLNGNVENSIIRLKNQLGVLVQKKSVLPLSSTTTTSNQDRDPNVLRLSACGSTSLWFPLLPIVASEKAQEKNLISSEKERNTMSKSTSSVSSRKTGSDSNKMKHGSTSFFGAMSQDWFR